jgi:hypothetical protein
MEQSQDAPEESTGGPYVEDDRAVIEEEQQAEDEAEQAVGD